MAPPGAVLQTSPDIDQVISLAYEAVGDLGRWPDVLGRVQQLVGADAVLQVAADATRHAIHGAHVVDQNYVLGMEAASAEFYAELAPISPIALKVVQAPAGCIRPAFSMTSRSVFERSAFFDQWARPNGVSDALLGPLTPNGPGMTVLSIFRADSGPVRPFQEQNPIERVGPHLSRALALNQRLAAANLQPNGVAADMLNALSVGIICIAAGGEVIWMNTAAETIVSARDGLIMDRDRRLATSSAGAAAKLDRLLANTQAGIGAAACVDRPSGRMAFCLTSASLSRPRQDDLFALLGGRRRPTGILVIHEPDQESTSRRSEALQARLRQAFGLTPAEALVAVLVTRHQGLSAVAQTLGVTHATVHTQLRRVFHKMEAESQSELSRRLEALGLLDGRPTLEDLHEAGVAWDN